MELRIKNDEKFTITKRKVPQSKQIEFIGEDGELIPKAREVFKKLFHKYCLPDNKMGAE